MRAAGGRSRISVRARVVLPEPDSPTMPRVCPASRRERHVVHRARHPGPARAYVLGGQPRHLEEAAHNWRSCGSNFTRSQSPRRFAESTMSMMQMPGSTVSHQ